MNAEVYYQENADKTYSLIVDGEVFRTPLTSENEIGPLTEAIDDLIYMVDDYEPCATVIVKLSDEADPIGLIVDIYENGTEEEPTQSEFYLFDDFKN